jgi:hypothetical protein
MTLGKQHRSLVQTTVTKINPAQLMVSVKSVKK